MKWIIASLLVCGFIASGSLSTTFAADPSDPLLLIQQFLPAGSTLDTVSSIKVAAVVKDVVRDTPPPVRTVKAREIITAFSSQKPKLASDVLTGVLSGMQAGGDRLDPDRVSKLVTLSIKSLGTNPPDGSVSSIINGVLDWAASGNTATVAPPAEVLAPPAPSQVD